MYFQTYTIAEECPPRILHQPNQYQYLSSDNLFHKAKSLGGNDEIFVTNEFSFGDIPEGIPLEDPLYDNLKKTNDIANLTINTDEGHTKNEDTVKKNYYLVKEAGNELEISEIRPANDNNENIEQEKQKSSVETYYAKEEVSKSNAIPQNLSKKNNDKHMSDTTRQKDSDLVKASSNLDTNNVMKSVELNLNLKKQAEIIVQEATLGETERVTERVDTEQVSKVYPIGDVNAIYAEQNVKKETVDLPNSNYKYQKSQDIPSSPYFTLEKYENEEQNVETYKEEANVKEVDSNGYIISDKLNFGSAEINTNLRQNKQYSPEIQQEIPNVQPHKESDNEISKIYDAPHTKENGLNQEYSKTNGPQIKQAILDNPIMSYENEQFVDINQGAKDIENPLLTDFHVIDSEKDLDVPDGVEGPVPAIVLPPPSNRRGYIAVPFNSK